MTFLWEFFSDPYVVNGEFLAKFLGTCSDGCSHAYERNGWTFTFFGCIIAVARETEWDNARSSAVCRADSVKGPLI
jgi:hypothetical protein